MNRWSLPEEIFEKIYGSLFEAVFVEITEEIYAGFAIIQIILREISGGTSSEMPRRIAREIPQKSS